MYAESALRMQGAFHYNRGVENKMCIATEKRDPIMVKHIILWQLKDEFSAEEKAAIKADIKAGLEGLVGKVPGLLEVHVNIDPLETSNADLMLDSTLESFEALKGYAVHPDHVAVADGKVRPNVKARVCMDYEV